MISVTIMHPLNEATMEVDVDETFTIGTIICELIAASFIPDFGVNRYMLLNKEIGTIIEGSETLADAEASDGAEIRVVCWTSLG